MTKLVLDLDTEVDGFSLYALVRDEDEKLVGFLQIAQGDMAADAPYGEDGIAAYKLTGEVAMSDEGGEEYDYYLEDNLLAVAEKVGDVMIGSDDDCEEGVEGSFGDDELAEYEQAAVAMLEKAIKGG